MALVFVGALAVAVLGACIAFIIQRTFRLNARWLIPASAGAGMLGFTIYNDYSWFERTAGGLPQSFRVTATGERSTAIQPWSLAVPVTVRFTAVDLGSLQAREADPSIRRAPVHLVGRHQPTFTSLQLFDCAANRQADAEGGDAGPDGLPPPAAWIGVPAADPLLRAVCDAPVPG